VYPAATAVKLGYMYGVDSYFTKKLSMYNVLVLLFSDTGAFLDPAFITRIQQVLFADSYSLL
jgi:hypothetical protein